MNSTLKRISPETLKLIEDHARNLGISPDEYLRPLLRENHRELALKPDPTEDEFEKDMAAFAESTEELPGYSGTYSREDIYSDHN